MKCNRRWQLLAPLHLLLLTCLLSLPGLLNIRFFTCFASHVSPLVSLHMFLISFLFTCFSSLVSLYLLLFHLCLLACLSPPASLPSSVLRLTCLSSPAYVDGRISWFASVVVRPNPSWGKEFFFVVMPLVTNTAPSKYAPQK